MKLSLQLRNGTRVPLESLVNSKYRNVICYPRFKVSEFKHRLKELNTLKIKAIIYSGQKYVNNTPVLGKGCVGIVVTAQGADDIVALKIRRTDTDRRTMQHEAEMLRKANSVNVGPHLLGATDNFISMTFVNGKLLPEWIGMIKGETSRRRINRILRLILEQAWRLDKIGLSHGELSTANKHIIVTQDDSPCIVDFETASLSRRASNITSLSHYLFIGSSLAKIIRDKRASEFEEDKLLQALRTYKKTRKRENFEELLKEVSIC